MLPKMRSDEKLPRGSYFYIQVGHRFYAGEDRETRKVLVSDQEPGITGFQKNGRPNLALAKRWAESGALYPFRRGNNQKRRARDERKGSVATYAKPIARKEKTYRDEFTGKVTPRLVDTKEQAKQFRKKDSALSACEKLKACYQGLDVTVTVKMEGETK